jgi:protein ImuB
MVKNPVAQCFSPSPSTLGGGRGEGEPSLVLIRTIATQQIVVAVNESAQSRCIKPGMTLAQAKAIDADLFHDEHDPSRDAKALEALARWMMRFSPVVSLPLPLRERAGVRGKLFPTGDTATQITPTPLPQGEREQGILLDITGCDRVFKGLPSLIAQLRAGMKRLKIACALAVAPTPGAAWALSFSRKHQDQIISQDHLASTLHPLPPMTLRLPEETVKMLHHLGLTTIGQLEALPRETLPARFGSILLTRIDQAFGRIAEPLIPLEPFSPIEAKREFDGAVAALEPLWITLRELIDVIMKELLRRGRGARTVEAEFLRESTPPLHRTIRLSRPSRDGLNLFNLLRCTLEDLDAEVKGNKRRSDGATERRREQCYVDRDGFVGIRLLVSTSEPLSDEQITLLGQEQYQGQIELDRWIERLTVRMGAEALTTPRSRESHLPERAFFRRTASEQSDNADQIKENFLSRPLLLLHTPRELRVTVSPSHDRDGRPVQFVDTGNLHRLIHAIGPERIAGQWWEGHDKTRDYFEVEDETGRRFWIFRVNENGRWFVQGEYS